MNNMEGDQLAVTTFQFHTNPIIEIQTDAGRLLATDVRSQRSDERADGVDEERPSQRTGEAEEVDGRGEEESS